MEKGGSGPFFLLLYLATQAGSASYERKAGKVRGVTFFLNIGCTLSEALFLWVVHGLESNFPKFRSLFFFLEFFFLLPGKDLK